MRFASVRIVTDDVDRLAAFYERLLGSAPDRPAPVFAAFRGTTGTLAISTRDAVGAALAPVVEPRGNRSVILEFQVDRPDEVDAAFARLRDGFEDVVQEPATMPWGNRSFLVLDPDGSPLNVFATP